MTTPSISVVIPTYNYAHFLPSALESVLGQTMATAEVIVVDDGSTDQTPRVLEGYADRVHVVRRANGGLAAARNSGAAVAAGEWLAFLDSDDEWLPPKLERQMTRAATDPEVALVHCGAQEIDATGRVLRERLDGMEGLVADEMVLFRRTVVLLAGSTMVVRRAVFEAVGGFDDRMRHSEDWDFCYRVGLQHKIAFVPEPLVRYRIHGTNMHKNVAAMESAMLFAFGKAFAAAPPTIRRLRRRAYGRLHTVLAGSYFNARQYGRFLRHAALGLALSPENLPHFLGYPLRCLKGIDRA